MRLALCLLAFCTLVARGQEITDLGVITARKGIILDKCTNRTDFLHFKIELLAQRWPSNMVSFTTTNQLLTLESFMAMPPGPCIMGVRQVCSDGDESTIALFKVDVRRDPPKAPRAHTTQVGGPGTIIPAQSTENVLKSRFHSRTNQQSAFPPPMPPGLIPFPGPLPPGHSVRNPDLSREAVRSMAMAEESVRELTNSTVMATVIPFPGPLPGGSGKTYSDHMVEMHDFMTRQGRHRSE